jgi:5-methylcytosine-specific restriction endonuclease McrA
MIETIKYQCYYCRDPLDDTNRTKDHIVPKSKGGILSKKNKVFACRKCNRNKGDLTLQEWLDKLNSLPRTKKNEKMWLKKAKIIPILIAMIEQLKYK